MKRRGRGLTFTSGNEANVDDADSPSENTFHMVNLQLSGFIFVWVFVFLFCFLGVALSRVCKCEG